MSKPIVPRKLSAVSPHPTPDTPRTPEALDARRAEIGAPRAVPEDLANDHGYLSQRLWGLSALLRSASHEGDLSQAAHFFVTAALDDIAERLTR